jgi:hypothetical protein
MRLVPLGTLRAMNPTNPMNPMHPVETRGAVFVLLRGPADKREAAMAALRKAGIDAEESPHGPDVIEAYFYGDGERPSPYFMDRCASRVAKALIGGYFTVEETGTIESRRMAPPL